MNLMEWVEWYKDQPKVPVPPDEVEAYNAFNALLEEIWAQPYVPPEWKICKVCGIPGCIETRGRDFHKGPYYGSLKCDYSGQPPFADAEWANDDDPLCLWCAGTGHPYGDESYGICECPEVEP